MSFQYIGIDGLGLRVLGVWGSGLKVYGQNPAWPWKAICGVRVVWHTHGPPGFCP